MLKEQPVWQELRERGAEDWEISVNGGLCTRLGTWDFFSG